MNFYWLTITSHTTGRVSVLSFDTAFDRALELIRRAAQPVTCTLGR